MTQPIAPTMWPKVEGPCKIEGDYWWYHEKDNRWLVSPIKVGYEPVGSIYGPITFAKPVPSPEVTLYLVRTNDGDKWCQADAVDGRKDKILYDVGTCRSRGSIEQANIIRTATLKEQA